MYDIADYSQPLRAIGQALEALNVQTFEMEPAGAAYLIRGAAAIEDSVTTTQRVSPANLRSTRGDIASQEPTLTSAPQAKNETATSRIEVNYTPKDVERLEIAGRAKRGETSNMADPSRRHSCCAVLVLTLRRTCPVVTNLLGWRFSIRGV